jgi:hypothetical protein
VHRAPRVATLERAVAGHRRLTGIGLWWAGFTEGSQKRGRIGELISWLIGAREGHGQARREEGFSVELDADEGALGSRRGL